MRRSAAFISIVVFIVIAAVDSLVFASACHNFTRFVVVIVIIIVIIIIVVVVNALYIRPRRLAASPPYAAAHGAAALAR
jgi:hypothetical protein